MKSSVEYGVPVLRVHVRSSGTPNEGATAVFEVSGPAHAAVKLAELPTSELGLPDVVQRTPDVVEARLQIPGYLRRTLANALNQAASSAEPVCLLDLPAPHGYLHLMPWERLLGADLATPLVRLPRYELVPRAKWPLLVTIVAGRSPLRPEFSVATMVADAVQHWCSAYADGRLAIDIFVPSGEVAAVRDAVSKAHADDHEVNVHEPPGDPETEWRTWIGGALEGRAVDILHLIGHGAFRAERGLLALPRVAEELPGRSVAVDVEKHEQASEFSERSIGANDLCASLTRLGAWALVITAPRENASPAALRDLSTAVNETRPGVVMLHQYSAAADTHAQAEESLRMVTGEVRDHRSPDISCWHPVIASWFVRNENSSFSSTIGAALTTDEGTSALIDASTANVLGAPDVPAWVASGTRTLETLHAQLLGSASSPPNPDAVQALQSVSASFNQQVREWSNQHSTGGIT